MGVMECGRRGCENIMCDHYLDEFGVYLCNDCLMELGKLLDRHPMNSNEIREFIHSVKNEDKTYSSITDLIGE